MSSRELVLDVIELHRAAAIGDGAAILHANIVHLARRAGERVRLDRLGMQRRAQSFVEVEILLLGHDQDVFGRKAAKPACVIEVMMGVDDIAQRLGRNEAAHFPHHRLRALFVQRRFDDQGEFGELDGNRIVVVAADQPDAWAELSGLYLRGIVRSLTYGRGNFERRIRHIDREIGGGEVVARMRRCSDALVYFGPEREAVELAVLRIAGLDKLIADDGIGMPTLDLGHVVGFVDPSGERISVHVPEGHGADALGAAKALGALLQLQVLGLECRADETVRGHENSSRRMRTSCGRATIEPSGFSFQA